MTNETPDETPRDIQYLRQRVNKMSARDKMKMDKELDKVRASIYDLTQLLDIVHIDQHCLVKPSIKYFEEKEAELSLILDTFRQMQLESINEALRKPKPRCS